MKLGTHVIYCGQPAIVNQVNEDGTFSLFIFGVHGQGLAYDVSSEDVQIVSTINEPPPAEPAVPLVKFDATARKTAATKNKQ